jgi:UDP-N-acetylglucosamine 2-epimerase (non-hydrolysing)
LARKKKIISVVGARPNFMKLAPLERELRKYKSKVIHKIVHTGQHYDYTLSKIFFKDLELPLPDIYLGAGSASHAEQTAKIMAEFEKVILKERPDLVIVFGDVNSTLACSLVCSKIAYNSTGTIPVCHAEAGLRSFDRSMPEEINRIVTDSLSKFLLVTERAGVVNLIDEGVPQNRIFLVGDLMIDSLIMYKKKFINSKAIKNFGLDAGKFILVTIHRPVNVDNKKNLSKIISILRSISNYASSLNLDHKIVFPIHPRTQKMINSFGLKKSIESIKNIVLTEPIGYSDFIGLLMKSKLVITDSGGIQEEATFLKIPCLTLRNSFERPETISIGTNTLCSLDEKLIMEKTEEIYNRKYKKGKIPRLMDGKTSKRIVKILFSKALK